MPYNTKLFERPIKQYIKKGELKLEKNIFEKIRKAQSDQEIAYINFFNNGKVVEDKRYLKEKINEDLTSPKTFELIEDVLVDVAKKFAYLYKYDTIDMNLLLGLIYNASDVNEDKSLKENVKPYNGIVRFYTDNLNCYLNGEKVNSDKYNEYGMGRQSFINFNYLIKSIKKSGLDYNGPESFEELKEAILSGKKFDITLTADLTKNIKETKTEENKPKIKNLFKR